MFAHGMPKSFYAARAATNLNQIGLSLISNLAEFNPDKSDIFSGMDIKIKGGSGGCTINAHGYQIETKLKHSYDSKRETFLGNICFHVLDDNGNFGQAICAFTFDSDGRVIENEYFAMPIYPVRPDLDRNSPNILLGVVAALHNKCCTLPIDNV